MTRSLPLVVVGGGGHALACLDVLECVKAFRIAGIVDPALPAGSLYGGYPVLGGDEALEGLAATCPCALVGVGQIKSPRVRIRLYETLRQLGFSLPSVVSPLAYLSPHAALGEGSLVMHHAVVNTGAAIGKNAILNTGAIIEHECRIGDHCHIAVGAVLCGNVTVGDGAFIGAGAVCRQGVSIGAGAVVGCGVRVIEDVPPHTLYTGRK